MKRIIIKESIKTEYPDLIELILNSTSMDEEEKYWWFDMINHMSDQQIDRIQCILKTERDNLSDIEKKYISSMEEINKFYNLKN